MQPQQFQISSSATATPTGPWSNNIVATTTTNPYLWMKATLHYTDGTTKDFYLVSQKGDKGDIGADGRSSYTHIAYANSSDSERNMNNWVLSDPAKNATTITYNNGVNTIDYKGVENYEVFNFPVKAKKGQDFTFSFSWTQPDVQTLDGASTGIPVSIADAPIYGPQIGRNTIYLGVSKTNSKLFTISGTATSDQTYISINLGFLSDGLQWQFKASFQQDFSHNPGNHEYMGWYSDFTALDSNDPSFYGWSLIKGKDGLDGAQGPRGPVGTGLVVKGTVKDASQLPTAGNQEGYCYFIGKNLYIWDAGEWKNCGDISQDLSNYVTVTDLNNGLSNKVTDNKDGTEQLNGVKVQPYNKLSDVTNLRNIVLQTDNVIPYTAKGTVGESIQDFLLYSGFSALPSDTQIYYSYDLVVTNADGGVHWLGWSDPWDAFVQNKHLTTNGIHHFQGTTTIPGANITKSQYIHATIDNSHATYQIKNLTMVVGSIPVTHLPAPEDKVNISDMRKPAGDVAGIEEVNAKQDKIGYTPADDSKVVHSKDMRKPASDVAGIDEVNAKQDKIAYTPADDSKVLHSTITQLNSTDMNTVLTAGFYQSINGTNEIPSGDNWTIYQVIPLSVTNGVQVAYETNNTVLGLRSWNWNSGHLKFTSWVQFADDSKVVHSTDASNWQKQAMFNSGDFKMDTTSPTTDFATLLKNKYNKAGVVYIRENNGPSYAQFIDAVVICEGIGYWYAYGINQSNYFVHRQITPGGDTGWVVNPDDSKVAHLSGANNFDTVPTVNNNPLLLASSLPSNVATKTDVTNAVNAATANMVDSSKLTNFTGKLQQAGSDVVTQANWVESDSDTNALSSSKSDTEGFYYTEEKIHRRILRH